MSVPNAEIKPHLTVFDTLGPFCVLTACELILPFAVTGKIAALTNSLDILLVQDYSYHRSQPGFCGSVVFEC